MAPKIPLAAIGTLLQMCAQQRGLVQFRSAAHHQHPALMCPDSLQKLDERVTFAMPAYEPYGGPCQREGIAIGLGPTTLHHNRVMAGRWLGSPSGPPDAASPSSCAGVVLGQIPGIGSLRDFSQH
jgi:hypothetical protein